MLTSTDLLDVPAQPILTLQVRAAPSELGPAIGAALAQVMNAALARGSAGAAVVRRQRRSAAEVTVLVGVCVDPGGPAATGPGLELHELPAGRVAHGGYTGTYAELDAAHAALADWARSQGLEPAGAPWEVHLTGPTDVSDAAHAEAQLFLPVRRAP